MCLAIKYAASNKTQANKSLWGGKLSSGFMADIFDAYNEFKRPIIKQIETKAADSMTNKQQFAGILTILNSDERGKKSLEYLNAIGSEKEDEMQKLRDERKGVKLEGEDLFQKWIKDFDRKKRAQNRNGRFVNAGGAERDLDGYFDWRMNGLNKLKQ